MKNSQKIYIVQKVIQFTIFSNYFRADQLNLTANTLTTTKNGKTAAKFLLYLSFVLNSKSSFAMKGLMTIHLFQLSKFLEVMFPLNAHMVFTNFSKNSYFVKHDIYETTIIQQLLQGLPQIFISYNTSLYILNDILNEYILILILWGVALLCLIFSKIQIVA